MPFNRKPQKFNASIKEVTIGCGEKAVTLGGENVYPFYSFDGEITNAPKVAVEISDMGVPEVAGLKAYYEGCSTMAEIAKRASEMEGADFVCLRLEGGDPNGANKSVDELIAVVKEVADAIDVPLAVEGCKNVEKDGELLPKVAEALQGKNALILSAREEDYKSVGAAAGLAYDQKVGAESAAVGYGFEYVVSTMDRIKAAALSQSDAMLQMPIITPVSSETWNVKESMASEEDMPEWGPVEERAISMEIMTAAADLACGSDAVILMHPQSIATISKMIKELV